MGILQEETVDTIERLRELKEEANEEIGWTLFFQFPDLFWSYEVDGKPVGFIKEIPVKSSKKGLIQFAYIHPDERGKGYGREMVERWAEKYEVPLVNIQDEEKEEFYKNLEPTFLKVKVKKNSAGFPAIEDKHEYL